MLPVQGSDRPIWRGEVRLVFGFIGAVLGRLILKRVVWLV